MGEAERLAVGLGVVEPAVAQVDHVVGLDAIGATAERAAPARLGERRPAERRSAGAAPAARRLAARPVRSAVAPRADQHAAGQAGALGHAGGDSR